MIFMSTSEHKLRELQYIFPNLQLWEHAIDAEVQEIQSINVTDVAYQKMQDYLKVYDDEFIVEDTGLHLLALNGFPGALAKSMLQTLSPKDIYEIANSRGDLRAVGVTSIYHHKDGVIKNFFGSVDGILTAPTTKDYGWDSIFIPEGYTQTYGQMGEVEKVKDSPRTRAAKALKGYLTAIEKNKEKWGL